MQIDFSAKHTVFLKDRQSGLLRRMDEPYYESMLIGPGIWQIISDGCLSYLVEGAKEAVVIDTGYGSGSIRDFCQTLTLRPVRRVINTHDHFDHTALNSYFDCAIMSEKTAPLATIPFPSFAGVAFPSDYKKQLVADGDKIDLGDRTLEVFAAPDHAVGSIVLLDTKGRTLFVGDETGRDGKDVSHCLETVQKQFHRLLERRKEFDWLCHGHMGKINGALIDRIVENIDHILAGNEGAKLEKPSFRLPPPEIDGEGNTIIFRNMPHPGDVAPKDPAADAYLRVSRWAGCEVSYDIRYIREA